MYRVHSQYLKFILDQMNTSKADGFVAQIVNHHRNLFNNYSYNFMVRQLMNLSVIITIGGDADHVR